MKMNRLFLLFLIIILGCIEPISFESPGTEDPVAISGYITDQNGPHLITVGYSVPYTTKSFNGFAFVPVSTASVSLVDDNGGEYILTQDRNRAGYYYTDSLFRGIVGYNYKILVDINDDEQYESEWTELKPVAPIEDLYITPYESTTLQNGIEVKERGVEAKVKFNDPEGEDNYYRWRYNGVYEVQFSLDRRGPCWITERDIDGLNVLSDGFQDGMTIDQTTALIEIRNRPNAQNKYILSVEHMSLSQDAYEFYKTVKEQREQQGTIFDATPAPIRGNMKSRINEEEIVLGLFHASALDIKRISIQTIIANAGEIVDCDEFIAMGFLPPNLCYNCRELAFSSRTRPEWY